MACGATLKRTMDFDPLMSPTSPKRRRCVPVAPSASSPRRYLSMEPSPFGESSSRLSAGKRYPAKPASGTTSLTGNWWILSSPFVLGFTRTNPEQHQTGVQTYSEEETSRWGLPTTRELLFSRVPFPAIYECIQHARLVKEQEGFCLPNWKSSFFLLLDVEQKNIDHCVFFQTFLLFE